MPDIVLDSEYCSSSASSSPVAIIYSVLLRLIDTALVTRFAFLNAFKISMVIDLALIDLTANAVITWTDDITLESIGEDINKYIESEMPDLNEAIQKTGKLQTKYNAFVEELRALAEKIPPEILEKIGITQGIEQIKELMEIPKKFVSSAKDILEQVLAKILEAFNIPEYIVDAEIYLFVNKYASVTDQVDYIRKLIIGFDACKGEPTKSDSYTNTLIEYLAVMPIDSTATVLLDYKSVIKALTVDEDKKNNLLASYDKVAKVLDEVKKSITPAEGEGIDWQSFGGGG